MFEPILKKVKSKKYETSVLVPIREDKRIYALLKALSKQKYKNFLVMIANDSKKPYLNEKDFPKNLNYVFYHSPESIYSTFDKLNFLIDQVKSPYAAITESDCIPSDSWLSELIPAVRKEKKVLKGIEARPVGCCTANLVFPSPIGKKIKFDTSIPIVADFEWGMNLEKQGHKIKFLNDKGLVYHNLVTGKARFNRIIPCAKDDVAMAFKYKSPGFLWRKILRNGYEVFRGISQNLFYLVYTPYFAVKSLFKIKS